MSFKRHRHNLDANHKPIVSELRKRGVEVIEIMKPVDICLHHRGWTGFGEIKTEGADRSIELSQVEFMAFTNAPVAFIRSTDEAMEFVKNRQGLSAKQKSYLMMMLAKWRKKQYTPRQIELTLAGQIAEAFR